VYFGQRPGSLIGPTAQIFISWHLQKSSSYDQYRTISEELDLRDIVSSPGLRVFGVPLVYGYEEVPNINIDEVPELAGVIFSL